MLYCVKWDKQGPKPTKLESRGLTNFHIEGGPKRMTWILATTSDENGLTRMSWISDTIYLIMFGPRPTNNEWAKTIHENLSWTIDLVQIQEVTYHLQIGTASSNDNDFSKKMKVCTKMAPCWASSPNINCNYINTLASNSSSHSDTSIDTNPNSTVPPLRRFTNGAINHQMYMLHMPYAFVVLVSLQ